VLEGEMEFEIAGRVEHPKTGEELLIPAGTEHSARNIGKMTARWLYGYERPG
jgi:mannose-6-phosphate isomerase-like protein (cupin superfamily)